MNNPTNTQTMLFKNQLLNSIFEEVRKQGFSILLMSAGIVFFYFQNKEMQSKVDACMNQRIEYLKEERKELIKSVNENTEVLKQVLIQLKQE